MKCLPLQLRPIRPERIGSHSQHQHAGMLQSFFDLGWDAVAKRLLISHSSSHTRRPPARSRSAISREVSLSFALWLRNISNSNSSTGFSQCSLWPYSPWERFLSATIQTKRPTWLLISSRFGLLQVALGKRSHNSGPSRPESCQNVPPINPPPKQKRSFRLP